MKKYIAFLFAVLLLSGCANTLTGTKSVTGLGTSPFTAGGNFTYGQANAMNNAINDNAAAIAVLQAFDATVQVKPAEGPFVDGDKTLLDSAVQSANVDDTPVDGATTDPISSNWAYDFQFVFDADLDFTPDFTIGALETWLGVDIITSGEQSASGTTIVENDSSIDVDDTGTGQIPVVVDGTEVAKFTAAANYFGQSYLSVGMASDDTFEMDDPIIFTAGASISQWQLVTYSADNKMDPASPASIATRAWGVALAASTDGNALYVGQHGIGRNDAWSWTPLAPLYMTTSGGITETAPSTSGYVVQPIGIARTATEVYFDINPVYGWGTAP